ncbi:hypothetical protein CLU79DRAFT_834983 [Phycomyces nitens]|nr:hypothetical protein CLU79DRAFT_834983 [Phycomyces nitens]
MSTDDLIHTFSRLEGSNQVEFRGIDYSQWSLRTSVDNRRHAELWKDAQTISERHELEIENGVRWSELHRLQYLDIVRATIISGGDLSNAYLLVMQEIADTMELPSDYSSLKTKIARGFPFMKADEWKSWVLIYSPVVLKPVLLRQKFNSWMNFVDACCLIVKPSVSFQDVDNAHHHLQQFCQELLKNDVFKNDYINVVEASQNSEFPIKGNEPLPPTAFPLQARSATAMSDGDYPHLLEYYKDTYDISELESYQHATSSLLFVDNQIVKLKSINLLGQVYRGHNGSGNGGSCVQALFGSSTGENQTAYTGEIQYMFIHNFTPHLSASACPTRQSYQSQHVFAFVRWYDVSYDRSREDEGVDICLPGFSPPSHECILPVHRLLLEVATAVHTSRNGVKRMLVISLPKKLCV